MIIHEMKTKSALTKSDLPVSDAVYAYAQVNGLKYVREDESMQRPFDAPPVIFNRFCHEEAGKPAKKGGEAHA